MSSSPHLSPLAPQALLNTMAVDNLCLPHPAFVPRPFPPPSLANVPLDFIVDRLHQLARHYWDKPETADCTIIVPVVPGVRGKPTPNARRRASSPLSPLPLSPRSPTKSFDPAGLGRRAPEPAALRRVSRITSKLHIDYLMAQSTLLRSLFTGAAPLDILTPPASPTSCARPKPPVAPNPASALPASRQPRLMPSPPGKPVVLLPLPDPSSFPHLVHYMYFGTTAYIEECLNRRVIQWEGVVRNVEYLGMRTEIKVFLGRWYAHWLAPARLRMHCGTVREGDEDESDYDSDLDSLSDSDSDSDDGMDPDVDDEDAKAQEVVPRTPEPIILEEAPRGRPLSRRFSQIPPDLNLNLPSPPPAPTL